MREARIAEQARALVAQRGQFGDHRLVVGLAAIVAARDPGAERLLAQFAAGGELQERFDAGAAERHRVLAFQPALLGGAARGRLGEVRQAGEIALAERHHVGLLVGEHVLPEGRAEARQPLADLLEPLFRRRVEPRAGPAEHRVVALQHARLLGRQAELATRLCTASTRANSRSFRWISFQWRDEHRRHVALDRLDRLAGMRSRQHVEHAGDARQQPARPLQRRHGVVETRFRRVGRDRVDLGPVPRQRLVEGGRKVLRLDLCQRRRPEWPVPFGKQRICGGLRCHQA